jgi:hypothetical protein
MHLVTGARNQDENNDRANPSMYLDADAYGDIQALSVDVPLCLTSAARLNYLL